MPILADTALAGRRNMICGANRDDYHLRHVSPGRDFSPTFHDLRLPAANDTGDAGAPVELLDTLEIGRLFSPDFPLDVLDASGRQSPAPIHACTLGLDRLLTALAEHHHDPNGLALPPAAAPFGLVITPVSPSDPACAAAAEALYNDALAANLNPLLDDRDERPGVKFKDADLTGIPFRLTIGKKLPDGIVELHLRRTRESRDVPLAAALDSIRNS
jgi:prolyl-tRNA synthetase